MVFRNTLNLYAPSTFAVFSSAIAVSRSTHAKADEHAEAHRRVGVDRFWPFANACWLSELRKRSKRVLA